MSKRGGKKSEEKLEYVPPRRRGAKGESASDFAIGRTIAGASHRGRTMSIERQKQRKKAKRKSAAFIFLILLLAVTLVVVVVGVLNEIEIRRANEKAEAERKAVTPTVNVYDENDSNGTSTRVNEFIVRLEAATKDEGLVIDHVTLPYQMAREVIVFLDGREEYYKLSIDRGAAVQAEDMERMTRFLDEKGIKCGYVDLRVEGRAYYK